MLPTPSPSMPACSAWKSSLTDMRARQRHFNPAHAGATLALDARYIDQANDSEVSTWSALPRSSFSLSQSTANRRPLLKLAAVNGQNTVRLDGSNDVMTCGRIATTSNFTTICLIKGSGQQNRNVWAQRDGGVANVGRTAFCTSEDSTSPYTTSRLFFNNGTSYSVRSTTTVLDGSLKMFVSESDGSGASHVRINNGAKEGTLTGQSWTPENANVLVGALVDGSNNAINAFSGDLSALTFFPEQLSNALRNKVSRSLAMAFKISCN